MLSTKLLAITLAAVMSLGLIATIQTQAVYAVPSKSIKCGDLKTLILKFNKPVRDFNVTVCPSGSTIPGPAGPPGSPGAPGATGASGRDGLNGINGTVLPADVIDKVNTLAAKAGVLDQIVAAYQNGSLGNGGGVEIGCIQFPNGTSIGDCPTGGNDNGTGGTGGNTTGNGTTTTPPVDNTTTTTNTTTTENTTSTETNTTSTNGTGTVPPIDNGTVITPPDNGTVIIEPPVDNGSGTSGSDNGSVIIPPNNGTVVVPPVDNSTGNNNTEPVSQFIAGLAHSLGL